MTDDIALFASLAHQYGPFLFAVLFTLVVVRIAHGFYKECRTNPKAKLSDVKIYRAYFISSFVFGMALVVASVGWWFKAQTSWHVYQVTVLGIESDEFISAEYYRRSMMRPRSNDVRGVADEHFIIVKNSPFIVGEEFSLEYTRAAQPAPGETLAPPSRPKTITFVYRGRDNDRFRLRQEGEEVKLVDADVPDTSRTMFARTGETEARP